MRKVEDALAKMNIGCRGGDRNGSNTRRRDEGQAQWDRRCSVDWQDEY